MHRTVRHPASSRTARLVVGVFALALALPAPAARAVAAGSIDLRLDRVDAVVTVSQGAPFPFLVTAENTGPSDQVVTVTIELQSPSSGALDVRTWKSMVPAGRTRSKEMAVVSSQWFVEIGTFILAGKIADEPVGNVLTSTVTPPTTVVPTFQDITGPAGLDTELPGDKGTSRAEGAAWGDVNGDGYPDLYVPLRDQQAQLWIYDPASGSFTEAAASWRITNPNGVGASAVFADFDNDGDEDLYVVNDAIDPVTAEPTGQGNRLYRNEMAQGRQEFTDVTVAAGVGTQGNGASASWGDYDNDGHLDLYVVTSSTFDPPMLYYHQDHLFHNEGNGTFEDVTCRSLPASDPASDFCPGRPTFGGSTGSGFQAVWLDFDRDGDEDLYLANDIHNQLRYTDINRLYRNDGPDLESGDWTFTDLCALSGETRAECLDMNSMGIAVGDYDGDLWPDLAISNTGLKGGNVLLHNEGDGTFTEVGAAAGIARPDQHAALKAVTWGLGFFDFNLDGTEDLYVAAGAFSSARDQPNQLFVNTPEAAFLDLSAPSRAAEPGPARGVAFADHDRDGLVDAYVVNVFGSPILFRNTTPTSGHWLEVALTGTVSNRQACGARVELTSGGRRQARWQVCGSSLGAGNDRLLHFGGLTGGGRFTLKVIWPTGLRQVVRGTGFDRVVEMVEAQLSGMANATV